jgi:hypothetical protein
VQDLGRASETREHRPETIRRGERWAGLDAIRLIMSGAVVGQELAAEFGPLPPSMLPVGMKRLYELQLAEFGDARPVHMVLPEHFQLSDFDRDRLDALGGEVVAIPEGLRLGEAVIYALNSIGRTDLPVRILHGDTLISDLPAEGDDLIVGGAHANEYAWAEINLDGERITSLETVPAGEDGQGRPIAAGYFVFSRTSDLIRCLTRSRGDFVEGVNQYLADHPVAIAPANRWLDFGHVQTFYQSRLAVSTARAFNTVRLDGLTAAKSSEDADKMRAEAAWLRCAPPDLQPYCARMVEEGEADGRAFYKTEYEYLPLLSELFVYGAIGRSPWMRILASCEAFLGLCARHQGPGGGAAALARLAGGKTLERLEDHARASGFDIDRPLSFEGRPCPSLRRIAETLAGALGPDDGRAACVMHGDFCFSNILYSPRLRRIKVIDPRGSAGAGASLYGDSRYDLAKLAHSVVGRYDQIIAGRYVARADGGDYGLAFEPLPHQAWLAAALSDLKVAAVEGDDPTVRAACAGLFLSMLPLHADRPDRQQAFIANALRLFRELA